jgi:hypothetical protein
MSPQISSTKLIKFLCSWCLPGTLFLSSFLSYWPYYCCANTMNYEVSYYAIFYMLRFFVSKDYHSLRSEINDQSLNWCQWPVIYVAAIKTSKSLCWIRISYNTVNHHHHVHEGLGVLSCSLILSVKLVPPSLPRSSYVPSCFWSIL